MIIKGCINTKSFNEGFFAMNKLLLITIMSALAIFNCWQAFARTSTLYPQGSCGICAQPIIIDQENFVLFIAPRSDFAHETCYNAIQPSFKAVDEKLYMAFPFDPVAHSHWFRAAFGELVKRVQLAAEPKTILKYAKINGNDKLKELFDKNVQPAIDHTVKERAKMAAEAKRAQE